MIFESKADKYSDIMDAAEWGECLDHGVFIPDDGCGYWGTLSNYSRKHSAFQEKPKEATHVHWYNQ